MRRAVGRDEIRENLIDKDVKQHFCIFNEASDALEAFSIGFQFA